MTKHLRVSVALATLLLVVVCLALPRTARRAWASPAAPAGWSRADAANYLDTRQTWWLGWSGAARGQGTACVSCHTSLPIALARPALGRAAGPTEAAFVADVQKRVANWNGIVSGNASCVCYYGDHQGASLGTESVMNALVLTNEDARRNHGALDGPTEAALAHLWEQQQPDGSWQWLDFGLSPWERDAVYYGTALAAVGVGMAGPEYDSRPNLQPKIALMCRYLHTQGLARPLHDRAACLWAASWLPGILSQMEKRALAQQLISAQEADGGWSLARLGQDDAGKAHWASQGVTPAGADSDGYATGLVVFALLRSGVMSRNAPALQRGLVWLQTHEQDGTWPANYPNENRDPQTDIGKFMRDSSTAFAVLALTEAKRA